MKSILIFVVGALFGALCLYAWQGYQFQRINMSATLSEIPLEDVLNRQSFRADYGKPVHVEKLGTGERFSLTLASEANGQVRYSWRSLTDGMASGEGALYENYEKVAKTYAGTHMKDVGSSLTMVLEDVKLEWSRASDSSGYIYYNPEAIALTYQSKD